jgi:hypothetical protein
MHSDRQFPDYGNMSLKTEFPLTISEVKGRTVTLSFRMGAATNPHGTTYVPDHYYVYLHTDVGDYAITEMTGLDVPTIISDGEQTQTVTISANVPSSATTASVRWDAYKASYTTASGYYCDFIIDNFTVTYYDQPFVELNRGGLKLYTSPINYVDLTASAFDIAVSSISLSQRISIGNFTIESVPTLNTTAGIFEQLIVKYKGTQVAVLATN